MEEDLKSGLTPIVQEFVSGKIMDRKLSVNEKNYLQWRKIVEMYM